MLDEYYKTQCVFGKLSKIQTSTSKNAVLDLSEHNIPQFSFSM